MTKSIGVVSSGKGENLRYILMAERSGRLPARVRIVLCDSPDAGALSIAREYKVPGLYLNPKDMSKENYDREMIKHLEEHDVEIVVLTGFMRILSPSFVKHYKDRILNIHPALLPSFPGMDAFGQALEYGVKWTGTTVHVVDEQVDNGPIIYQRPVPVRENDTHESLKARIQRAEYKVYPKAIKMFIEGKPKVTGRRLIWEKEAD